MKKIKIIIIAAMAKNRVIGNKNHLPWNIPEEYQHFVNAVKDNVMIMGRNAYENFETEGWENTMIIVLSKTITELNHPHAIALDSIEEVIKKARSYGKPVFIGGGASIYAQMMQYADEMWLSFLPDAYEGDIFFPEFDENDWEVVKTEKHPSFEFRVYKRKRS